MTGEEAFALIYPKLKKIPTGNVYVEKSFDKGLTFYAQKGDPEKETKVHFTSEELKAVGIKNVALEELTHKLKITLTDNTVKEVGYLSSPKVEVNTNTIGVYKLKFSYVDTITGEEKSLITPNLKNYTEIVENEDNTDYSYKLDINSYDEDGTKSTLTTVELKGDHFFTGEEVTHDEHRIIIENSKLGDFYLNTKDGNLYRLTKDFDGEKWGLVANIKGSSGTIFVQKGIYKPDFQYLGNDEYIHLCIYNGKCWMAVKDNKGTPPPDEEGVTFNDYWCRFGGDTSGVFVTTSPINNPIGKFSEGQTVEELDDISINEAINMLLHKDVNPEFTFTSTNVITNETGSTLTNIEFKVLFTNVGSGTISRINIKKGGVVIDSKTYSTGIISYSFVDSDTINLDTKYVAEVVYNFGNGDKILSKNLEFKFVKSGFYGTSNNETFTINSTNVRSLAPSLGVKKGSVLTINIPIGAKNVIFAYPSDLGDVNKVNYVEGMNADVKGVFTKTIAGITDASGTSVIMYNVYTYKPLTAFNQAVTYKVTV